MSPNTENVVGLTENLYCQVPLMAPGNLRFTADKI